jgi:hypothetical protein
MDFEEERASCELADVAIKTHHDVDEQPSAKSASDVGGTSTAQKFAGEDERRLAKLGYQQEVKRIFTAFSNFGNINTFT